MGFSTWACRGKGDNAESKGSQNILITKKKPVTPKP